MENFLLHFFSFSLDEWGKFSPFKFSLLLLFSSKLKMCFKELLSTLFVQLWILFCSPQQSFPLLYLEIISIIFFPQKYEFFLFYFSVSSSLSRLTKRKNELNLIANRDATTQLLCQYAKNTQTFNSRGCWMEFFFWCSRNSFAFFIREKKTHFLH